MCMFCRSLFVLLFFFVWPLYCLFFFDLWILIIPIWYLQTLLITTLFARLYVRAANLLTCGKHLHGRIISLRGQVWFRKTSLIHHKNEQSRETGNIRHTRRRKTKQNHNTICVGHHYMQTDTNNVNKTWALLQTTGGKDERTSFLCGKRNVHHNTELRT